MFLLSYSKRPIKVLLPSSTLPAVINLSMSINVVCSLFVCLCSSPCNLYPATCNLKISILLSVFHSGFRHFIINTCFAPFTCFGGYYFADNILYGRSVGSHSRGAGHIAHCAVAHFFLYNYIRCINPYKIGYCHVLSFIS